MGSKINSFLTLEYITTEHENKYFDRKSAQIKHAELASLISSFANADGSTFVIGIRGVNNYEYVGITMKGTTR